MIKGKLPVVREDHYSYYDENEEGKYQKFLSPLPKNRYHPSSSKPVPRKSGFGLSNFNPNAETSPIGDRFIPKRSGQESNIAMYEINHEDSPPVVIDRDNFDNSWEYEECKAEYSQKLEYEGVLKEAFFGPQSPSKDYESQYVEANLFISPQKANEKKDHRPYKKKLLNFKRTKSNKENQQRLVRNNTLKLSEFRVTNITAKQVEKVAKIYPERVLDAPKMVDDFYLNLLDWSPTNVLAIALENFAYLMDVSSKQIS